MTALSVNGTTSPAQITHTGGFGLRLFRSNKTLDMNANYGASDTHAHSDRPEIATEQKQVR